MKTVIEIAKDNNVSQHIVRKFARDNNIKPLKIVKRAACYNPEHFYDVGVKERYIEKITYITETFYIFESKMNT